MKLDFINRREGGHGLNGNNDQKYELVWEFFKKH
ncbi:uncharacterized protein METZ01_LOCUS73855 [marine metagenome]|uniref:Uncharacterized protein n=1 Tax=marine metagenome TaxID=408172 RepID=A0A381TZU5_9ZZZZ